MDPGTVKAFIGWLEAIQKELARIAFATEKAAGIIHPRAQGSPKSVSDDAQLRLKPGQGPFTMDKGE